MKLKKAMAGVAATLVLGGAAFSASAANTGFAALQGVEAQPLSVQEMQAISGQLNALDIAAALTAKAATLDAFPKLQAAVLKLAAFYTANADQINALFMKLGVYTAPK